MDRLPQDSVYVDFNSSSEGQLIAKSVLQTALGVFDAAARTVAISVTMHRSL